METISIYTNEPCRIGKLIMIMCFQTYLLIGLTGIRCDEKDECMNGKSTWQHPVSILEKLYGDAGNLELTAAFIRIINVNV
jgi:hypothetical protein